MLRGLSAAAGAACALGLGTLAYANRVELNRFTLRHAEVVVPGLAVQLRLLHISDIHYVPGQQKKHDWLQQLAAWEPDFVVNTGDNLSDPKAVPEVLSALGPLMDLPGCFVPGSNDYYAPQWKNPLKYFTGPSTLHPTASSLPTEDLFGGFDAAGWINLSNTHAATTVGGVELALSGVDDPHIERNEFSGWPETDPQLRIGVAHAPQLHVLETFTAAKADLVLAGHTHGGQVCLPSLTGTGRALVTNCDLPVRYAKGLHSRERPGGGHTHVHVSAGLGTSAKAPVRLFCPPEATLLTLRGS